MSEFTKGEWTTDDYGVYVFAHEEQMMICMMRGYGYLKSKGLSDEEITEVQKANARLIASAPEMYEFLKIVLSVHEEGNEGDCVIVAIRKLIDRIDGNNEKSPKIDLRRKIPAL